MGDGGREVWELGVGWLPFFQASGGSAAFLESSASRFLSIHEVRELTHTGLRESMGVLSERICDLAVKHIYHYRTDSKRLI